MTEMRLQQVRDRHQMIRFFDGYAVERMEELDQRKLKRPLAKTYLLELLDGQKARTPQELQAIFGRRGVLLQPLDEWLFLVTDSQNGEIG
ncbi:MAG: hypothetical protein QJR13_08130, partial [Bacillota bacterium]|nr:hypothetical protein [Bacillota bacterium]